MAFLVLGGFLLVVVALSVLAHRRGSARASCCAPPDPADDLRMRSAFDRDA